MFSPNVVPALFCHRKRTKIKHTINVGPVTTTIHRHEKINPERRFGPRRAVPSYIVTADVAVEIDVEKLSKRLARVVSDRRGLSKMLEGAIVIRRTSKRVASAIRTVEVQKASRKSRARVPR